MKTNLKKTNGKRWFCQQCNTKEVCIKRPSLGASGTTHEKKEYTLKDVMDKLEDIDLKYTNLLEKYEEQVRVNQSFEAEIKKLKQSIEELEEKRPERECVNPVTETLQEINDREYKKKNLVVFGIQELDSDEAEERRCHDANFLCKMFEDVPVGFSTEKLRVVRIGKRQQGKKRPVKLLLSSEKEVRKVLAKAKDIKKKPEYNKLGFASDKTRQQLLEYKAVKEDLKRRLDEGEEDLEIKYVKGEPKIVTSKN